jgi:hypothetical protein
MVEITRLSGYAVPMPTEPESIVDHLIDRGRGEVVDGISEEKEGSLVTLRFADHLRRSAERLCHVSAEAARGAGASWREIGEAVGGITPQGAEHRFSPGAKERRSKASKVKWASEERRAT